MTWPRVWGRKVRLKGGSVTHWAGADHDGTSRLAHDDWAWTDTLRDPLPDGRECQRCVRRQPAFFDMGDNLR